MSYDNTLHACYLGYITQAIVNNFAPLLFLTFASTFGLSLGQITLITTVNFLIQLIVDLLSAIWIDRIGYRKSVVAAHVISVAGIMSLAVLPFILPPYAGIMAAVVLYAVGGGLIEVLISPIVESCPTERKAAAMSLLHSFYCWGHLCVIILSTLFFNFVGIKYWRVLACLWAIVPFVNTFYFCFVPIYTPASSAKKETAKDNKIASPAACNDGGNSISSLLKNGTFWLLFMLMICAGASEQGMSQWASAFAESALHVTKAVGDLAGPASFALLMALSRTIYSKNADRMSIRLALTLSAALCIVCYIVAALSKSSATALVGCAVTGFSVGVFWPGTFSVAAAALPKGGTAMYALLALAGDVGCSSGPSVVGFVANAFGADLSRGLLTAMVFPIGVLVGVRLIGEVE